MNAKASHETTLGDIFRLSIILLWISALLIFYYEGDASGIEHDFWKRYSSINNDSTIIAQVASSGTIELNDHYLTVDLSENETHDTTISFTEVKRFSASLMLNSNTDLNDRLTSLPSVAEKLTSIRTEPNFETRSLIIGDDSSDAHSDRIRSIWDYISISLWICWLCTLIVTILISYRRASFLFSGTGWVVTFSCIVGVIQSAFILVQGGLLVSPLGKASSAIIPILLAHSIGLWTSDKEKWTSDKKKRTGRLIIWLLPVLVFLGGHIYAHYLSGQLYSGTVQEILGLTLSKYHIYAYAGAVSVGVLSLASRSQVLLKKVGNQS